VVIVMGSVLLLVMMLMNVNCELLLNSSSDSVIVG